MSLQLRTALRPLFLIVTGLIAGATLVGPLVVSAARPAAQAPASLQTRATSCSGLDFQPIDGTTRAYIGAALYRPTSAGSGFFVCHPDLPNGALVTKLQVTAFDNWNGVKVRYCGLERTDLRLATAGAIDTLAELPETGLTETPGKVRLTDTSISFATIDHTRYAYWLQCQLDGFGEAIAGVPKVGLYGATIIYKVNPATA